MSKHSVIKNLEELKKILEIEKQALIENDGEKINDLVTAKLEIVEQIEAAQVNHANEQEIKKVALEVKELQETNALLTEQALGYTNTFLSSLQNAAQKNTTYSKKGKMETEKRIDILDQSL